MAVPYTGQSLFDTLALANFTTTQCVAALNSAIDESWPTFKLDETHTLAGALDADTFEYSLSAITLMDRVLGPAEIYVTSSSTEPAIRLRTWWAYFDQSSGAWTVVFGNDTVDSYDGKTWKVRYQYPHPVITAIGDTLYLPRDYARYHVQHWYALKKLSESRTDDRAQWARYQTTNYELARAALLRNLSPTLQADGIIQDQMG